MSQWTGTQWQWQWRNRDAMVVVVKSDVQQDVRHRSVVNTSLAYTSHRLQYLLHLGIQLSCIVVSVYVYRVYVSRIQSTCMHTYIYNLLSIKKSSAKSWSSNLAKYLYPPWMVQGHLSSASFCLTHSLCFSFFFFALNIDCYFSVGNNVYM